MIFNNIKIIGSEGPVNIRVSDGKIAEISSLKIQDNRFAAQQLNFDNALIFPGLINSHDHLDFNLYPQLGNKIFSSYTEWGEHLHEQYTNEIVDILKIPTSLRAQWGVYKNLLCGVTTVINHGELLDLKDELITVFEDTHVIHSVQFEKNWKKKLNNPLKRKQTVTIHVGEGTDRPARQEIDRLIRWNLFRRKLVGIHGVAMTERQAKSFEAIVWCPQSNFFLLNQTAQIDVLKKHSPILFGTDSTLTGSWNIWDHLYQARKTGLLSDRMLYHSLNQNPAKTWKLNSGEIAVGKDADLVVAATKKDKAGLESFFAIDAEDLLLVMHKGQVRLFDESLLTNLRQLDPDDFSKYYIHGVCKFVKGDLPGLMQQIREHNPAIDFPISI